MTDADSSVVYESEVTQVGGQVEAFLGHGLLIFFGAQSPAELHDISVLHKPTIEDDGPRPGDLVRVGDTEVEVLAVGPVVRDNLLNLGHLDLKCRWQILEDRRLGPDGGLADHLPDLIGRELLIERLGDGGRVKRLAKLLQAGGVALRQHQFHFGAKEGMCHKGKSEIRTAKFEWNPSPGSSDFVLRFSTVTEG